MSLLHAELLTLLTVRTPRALLGVGVTIAVIEYQDGDPPRSADQLAGAAAGIPLASFIETIGATSQIRYRTEYPNHPVTPPGGLKLWLDSGHSPIRPSVFLSTARSVAAHCVGLAVDSIFRNQILSVGLLASWMFVIEGFFVLPLAIVDLRLASLLPVQSIYALLIGTELDAIS